MFTETAPVMTAQQTGSLGDTGTGKQETLFGVVFWDILPCKLHGSISQKTTLNIILAAVRT
jgi:hypothetical protein